MDDSNILYYLAIGAIYVISRFLKKKKKDKEITPVESSQPDAFPETSNKKPSSFEDLFKELTGENFSKDTDTPNIEPVVKEELVQSEIIPTYTNYDQELEDMAPEKTIDREKPVFERNEHFKVKTEESNEVGYSLFEDKDDLRRAIILKEVLDRRY